MTTFSNKQAAELIGQTITFLKEKKISQQEIASRLNYTSLSKAKNIGSYPQTIIEKKTRQELLQSLFTEFSLQYNPEFERVELVSEHATSQPLSEVQFYIMHYYAFRRGVVDRAIIQIINKRKVIIDYRLDEHWEGICSVIENHTFIEVQKLGYSTPVKKLLCLFSGTMKYGRPFLLGTYSTVKRDGYPAAGRVLLQKAEDADSARVLLNEDSDYRIVSYLKHNVYVTKTFTPNSLNEINSDNYNHYARIVGEYHFIFPATSSEWAVIPLTLSNDFSASTEIHDIAYTGTASFYNVNVLNITFRIFKNKDVDNFRKQALTLDINVREKSKAGYYVGTANSPDLHGAPSCFSCYLLPKDLDPEVLLGQLNRQLFIGQVG